MSFTYGGISTNDLQGVHVTPLAYPNLGGLTLDTVETPGRDGRFYGGSRLTTSVMSFRVTVSGENQMQADQRRLDLLRMLDPSIGPRSLRLDNTQNWHYPQAVVAEQIEWEKFADSHRVIYDGTITFETNFDAAMRQIEPSTVSGSGRIEFIADMGSTVSYPTVIAESGGNFRVRVNDFEVDLFDTPSNTYAVLNWDEYKFYTADADVEQSLLYEWEGDPHDSTSVFLAGSDVIARNLVRDPSFEGDGSRWFSSGNMTLSSTTWGPRVFAGSRAVIITDNTGGNRFTYTYQTVDVGSDAEGKFLAFFITNFQAVGFDGGGFTRIGFLVDGSWQYTPLNSYVSAPSSEGGNSAVRVVQIPENLSSTLARVMLYPQRSSTEPLQEGDQLTTDGWLAAIADTEQEALAQVEHYFDGDTVGHIVPGERISSLVNHMSHFERPAIYPGQRVEVEVTDLDSNQNTPVIIYPNHRRL